MLETLAAALRRHGPVGLVRAAALRVRMLAERRALPLQERAYDRRRAIATAGTARLAHGRETTSYQAVHPRAMHTFLAHLPRDRSPLVFVDYGSGRGRGLFLAIEHGFGAAVGIELERSHHEAAFHNVRAFRGEGERITLVCGDARDFELPADPIVLFLYNPFGREIVEAVLASALEQLRARPRPAWVVYETPEHRELLDAEPAFRLIAERDDARGATPRTPRYAIWRVEVGGGDGTA
ncbi:MAG TPA: class I SAM-dependent methyltransferase [Solirubrobacteraceae bacterium]|jgi:SAM-dependent methyltransferase|nr:class I SAM-dependent methyltransferase [Solirubrobacteraceae bacterium]